MKSDNPYSAAVVGNDATDTRGYKVPFTRIFVAWLLFCVITFAASLAISLAIGALLVVILVAVGADASTSLMIRPIYAQSCGILVPVPVSLLCYWWTVHRIVLKKLDPPLA